MGCVFSTGDSVRWIHELRALLRVFSTLVAPHTLGSIHPVGHPGFLVRGLS